MAAKILTEMTVGLTPESTRRWKLPPIFPAFDRRNSPDRQLSKNSCATDI